jgi:hypothetical protein
MTFLDDLNRSKLETPVAHPFKLNDGGYILARIIFLPSNKMQS